MNHSNNSFNTNADQENQAVKWSELDESLFYDDLLSLLNSVSDEAAKKAVQQDEVLISNIKIESPEVPQGAVLIGNLKTEFSEVAQNTTYINAQPTQGSEIYPKVSFTNSQSDIYTGRIQNTYLSGEYSNLLNTPCVSPNIDIPQKPQYTYQNACFNNADSRIYSTIPPNTPCVTPNFEFHHKPQYTYQNYQDTTFNKAFNPQQIFNYSYQQQLPSQSINNAFPTYSNIDPSTANYIYPNNQVNCFNPVNYITINNIAPTKSIQPTYHSNSYPQSIEPMYGNNMHCQQTLIQNSNNTSKPKQPIKKDAGKEAIKPKVPPNINRECTHCKAKKTPQWRLREGAVFCNACYQFENNHNGSPRPPSLFRSGTIKKRVRGKLTKNIKKQ
uniref:GATA-type domain-containing protein n=1 Tax=Rhabditophanes sp. KR3021 TaxID=114890 RepID=A0AC35TVT5_9BILA